MGFNWVLNSINYNYKICIKLEFLQKFLFDGPSFFIGDLGSDDHPRPEVHHRHFGDDDCGCEKSLKCQRLKVEEFGSVYFRLRSVRHSSDRFLILSKCQNTGNTSPKETKENDIILQWKKIFEI